MPFWLAPIGSAIGGAVGKVLGKVAEWIPSREQYNRNKIKELERERDEIIKTGIPDNMRNRFSDIMVQLSKLKTDLQNR